VPSDVRKRFALLLTGPSKWSSALKLGVAQNFKDTSRKATGLPHIRWHSRVARTVERKTKPPARNSERHFFFAGILPA
jgi:hypothetical protein